MSNSSQTVKLKLAALALMLAVPLCAAEPADDLSQRQKRHWAFQPIARPAIPQVKNKDWVNNPIDAFVLAKLEANGLSPAPPADSATLLRRMYFDLIGLPPAPDDIQSFLALPPGETRVPIVEINSLLKSPHYGERWGRHWLDVVRYADSAGYELDGYYAHAWIYRDYVIRSLNADKPFDQFIREQLAGDELFPDSDEAKIGTSFATVGPLPNEGGIARPKTIEYQRLTDLADTTGAAFLGLTVGCARCHDHKFDPISQKDYFGLQAVFAASEAKLLNLNDKTAKVLAHRRQPETVQVLRRGDLDLPLQAARPQIFLSLPGGKLIDDSDKNEATTRRAALANWIAAPDNPLTARVLANRVWQWHFGKGIVRTPNDFGLQGEAPTHPELLDFLAQELINHKWSLKHLHRLIMSSSTYAMASSTTPALARLDPDHRLLTRIPRRRLEAETLWDNLHAAGDTLNREMFGPAVVPPIDPKALDTLINKNWLATDDPKQLNRRGMYLVVRRSITLPFFETFNVSQPVESSGRRDNTVVSSQALTLLNGPVAIEQARFMAGRLLRESGGDLDKLIARGWLVAFCRPVAAAERKGALYFLLRREKALASANDDKVLDPLGDLGETKVSKARAAAVVEWCLALINANEFLYVD